ncbi:hypothetical protein CkaCkLH20_13326 [Colletotrichum karsti]|uniref:Uncharacterized protein n=1 Tax=Colletotrichum karsti TaxID=1095194 RepID=A0A9P6HSU4_9PEZI|nr:uncharacterized protein CkaCkLH20_13326 [Colletotrichum karsti]KAF9869195.1 hypothetical protein CkaCkLH20_13326 [Colletotrichum karsti]
MGLKSFSISTFEWMARLWVDDYWFSTLDTVLRTIEALPLDGCGEPGQADWHQLATGLRGVGRPQDAVESFFFEDEGGRRARRDRGLLASLDDVRYSAVCEAIAAAPELAFPDLRRFLRTKKTDAQTANKPLLREHLLDALGKIGRSRGVKGHTASAAAAQQLQQRVLDFVRDHINEFTTTEEAKTLINDSVSLARLLRLVRRVTDVDGHTLRPEWQTAHATRQRGHQEQVSALVRTFCVDVSRLAADRPGLRDAAIRSDLQRKIEALIVGLPNGASMPSSRAAEPPHPGSGGTIEDSNAGDTEPAEGSTSG